MFNRFLLTKRDTLKIWSVGNNLVARHYENFLSDRSDTLQGEGKLDSLVLSRVYTMQCYIDSDLHVDAPKLLTVSALQGQA